MKIKIKTFATVEQILNFKEKDMVLADETLVKDLLNILITLRPELKKIKKNLLFAINDNYCDLHTKLKNKDILAIFPPVSGG